MSTVTVNVRTPLKLSKKPRQTQTRVVWLGFIIVLACLGLSARLWYLQVFMGEAIGEQALINVTRTIPTRAPRGVIEDRKGAPLADSRQSLSLEIAPDYQKTNPDLLKRLAPLLRTTPESLLAQIHEEKRTYTDTVRVADHLTPELVSRLEEQRIYLGGALIQPDPIRNYPIGTVATHLLGYLGMIDGDELKTLRQFHYRAGDYVGKTGIERRYNKWLRGEDGGRKVEVSPSGRIVRVLNEVDPHPGNTLMLTIDRRVQWAAQQGLAAEQGKAGAAVAIDPRTGEVLALASYPTYDIRPFSIRRPKELWQPLVTNAQHPLQNRAIGGQYPPASTFKPLEACIGLNSGAIPANAMFFCQGGMKLGKQWKGCHAYHGWVNFERSISESCDVFYYNAGRIMGIDQIASGSEAFGLGSKTGIDLGGEAKGIVPNQVYRDKLKKRGEKWYLGDTANTSIGQGHLQVTPLQMANAIAAIANGGTLYEPHLLKKAVRWNHQLTYLAKPTVLRKLPVRPEVIDRVRGAMRLTVTSGTGKVVNLPQIPVAAKTGTAQTRKGKTNHGWIVCFAPADHPTIAIAAIVEEGVHGADSGGPIAKAMLQAYFGLTHPSAPSEAPFQSSAPLRIQKKPISPAALGISPMSPVRVVETGQRFALLKGIQPPLPYRPAPALPNVFMPFSINGNAATLVAPMIGGLPIPSYAQGGKPTAPKPGVASPSPTPAAITPGAKPPSGTPPQSQATLSTASSQKPPRRYVRRGRWKRYRRARR